MVVATAKTPVRTVLIVEDAEACATTLEFALLGIPDIHIRVAPTARQALELLTSDGGGISALVTDLNLPTMDGFELIERVRSNSRTARLPIVVVSGDSDPRTPARIQRLGADAYFGKPYSPALVRQKVEQLLDANSSSPSP